MEVTRHLHEYDDSSETSKRTAHVDSKVKILDNNMVANEHLCLECKRKFNSTHLLDLHLEEAHSPFFLISVSKHTPGIYKCLEKSCNKTFDGPKDRKIHWRESHHISGQPEPPFYLHNRKRKKRQAKKSETEMETE